MQTDTPTLIRWHMVPSNWRWSHVVTIPEHDHDHPWGGEWPDDWAAAIAHLSEWDYGDGAHETVATPELDAPQVSRVMDAALVPFAGAYAIVSDTCGGITLYRLEEDMDTLDQSGVLETSAND